MNDATAPAPDYSLQHYGAAAPAVFLSVCIPTYKRAPKLARLLEQLQRIFGASAFRSVVELDISNNASPDETDAVIRRAADGLAAHCHVRAFTQHANIGGEPNFKFLYTQARGEYVWICPDDDILHEDQFDRLIEDLHAVRPEVCLSSFRMPPYGDDNPVFDFPGQERVLVTDIGEAAPHLTRLPKLTAYVYRRRALTPEQEAVSLRANQTTNYWFVALSVLLLMQYERRLLIRTPVLAHVDEDYLDLNFSPRVLVTIVEAYRLGLGDDFPEPQQVLARIPVPDVGYELVACLFRHTIGMNTMDAQVAREDYRYLRSHARQIVGGRGWRHVLKLAAILVLFPLIERYGSLRPRLASLRSV